MTKNDMLMKKYTGNFILRIQWLWILIYSKRNFSGDKMKDFKVQVGERIKELRILNKYTREELATKVGISVKFLYNIERGKQGFSAETLLALSEVFHMKCDYILKGSKESAYSNELLEAIDMLDESQMITLVKVLKAIYEMGIY